MKKRKTMNIIAVVMLAISETPWIYALAVSVWSALFGTTIGIFTSARTVYGSEAFLYTGFLYIYLFMPLYLISGIFMLAGIVLLIIANKKS